MQAPLPMHVLLEKIEADAGDHTSIQALADHGEAGVAPLLELVTGHDNGGVQYIAAGSLERIGEPARDAVIETYGDANAQSRYRLVHALEALAGEAAVELLQDDLRSGHPTLPIRAAGALLRLTGDVDRYLPPLVEVMEQGESWPRDVLVSELGRSGEQVDSLLERLEALRNSDDEGTAAFADKAWRAIDSPVAWRRRQAEHVDAITQGTHLDRAKAIYRIGQAGEAAVIMRPHLQRIVDDHEQSIELRGYAFWAIQQIAPPASDRRPRHYVVAQQHPEASDENPGTAGQPWRTIQRAAEVMLPGDRVTVHEGLYREAVQPFFGGTAEHPIVYQAAEGEDVVITGADVWTPDWQTEPEASTDRAAVYSTLVDRLDWDWPERWNRPRPHEVTRRVEQIRVDDRRTLREPSLEALSGTPFLVHYEGRSENPDRIWLSLPADTTPDAYTIERSVRETNFMPAVRGLSHIHVRDFEMKAAAPRTITSANLHDETFRAALHTANGYRWRIENNHVHSSSTAGMGFGQGWAPYLKNPQPPRVQPQGRRGYHEVIGNRFNDNGTAGIGSRGRGCVGLLIADNVTADNGWMDRVLDYESAGLKLMYATNSLITRHVARDNYGPGIWLDHNHNRVRISNCLSLRNHTWGIFLELTWNPIMVDHNIVIGTQHHPELRWADGIYGHDASNALIVNNISLANDGYAMHLRYNHSRLYNGEPTVSTDHRIFRNVLDNTGIGWLALLPEGDRARNYEVDHNLFLFQQPDTLDLALPGGTNQLAAVQDRYDLASTDHHLGWTDWREVMGWDRHSVALPYLWLGRPVNMSDDELLAWARMLREELARETPEGFGELDDTGQRFAADITDTRSPAHQLLPALKHASFEWPFMLDKSSPLAVFREGEDVLLAMGGASSADNNLPSDALWQTVDLPFDAPSARMLRLTGYERVRAEREPVPIRASRSVSLVDEFAASTHVIGPASFIVTQTTDGPRVQTPRQLAGTRYGLVLVHRDETVIELQPLEDRSPVVINAVTPGRDVDGSFFLNLDLRHQGGEPWAGQVQVRSQTLNEQRSTTLSPNDVETMSIAAERLRPVEMIRTTLSADGHIVAQRDDVLSFVTARRLSETASTLDEISWDSLPYLSLGTYPRGEFPVGADADQLIRSGLSARFAFAYDATRLYMRVEVNDRIHHQRATPDRAWQGDSIQWLVQLPDNHPRAAGQMLEWVLSLDNNQQEAHIHQVAPEDMQTEQHMDYRIVREGQRTLYTVALPWDVIGMTGPPTPTQPLRTSLLVNNHNNNQDGRHGLQWFRGIHHSERHDPSLLGWLWFETGQR